jgi:hypothetical protein
VQNRQEQFTTQKKSRDKLTLTVSSSTISMLTFARKSLLASKTYAIPPLIPAAKFRPVVPRMTIRPPVMYSQP